jgi:hypothetical protein
LTYYYDIDGSLVINARMPAEQGAQLVKALEAGTDLLSAEQRRVSAEAPSEAVDHEESNREPSDVSAEAPLETVNHEEPNRETFDVSAEASRPPLSSIRVDALCMMAEKWLTHEPTAVSDSDRYQVVVHVDHYRLVHEGGYTVEVTQQGGFIFHSPDGRALESSPPLPDVRENNTCLLEVERANQQLGLHIDESTCFTDWDGSPADYNIIVGGLM